MERFIEIRIELPDGNGVVEGMIGMTIGSSSEGVPHESIPAIIIKAAELIMQGRLAEMYAESMPMVNPEYIDMLAASDTRLAMVDTLMHLPATASGQHIETTIPR